MSDQVRQVVLLVDADYYAYNAASQVTKVVEWEDGILTTYADWLDAKQIFLTHLEAIQSALPKSLRGAPMVMCFTDTENWRKEVLPTYKSGRSGKPLAYRHLVNWIKEEYECFQRPTLEGDDCMGILSTAPRLVKAQEAIIVSPDKDFNTIPGRFLWWDSHGGQHELKTVSLKEADDWHMLQTLMGDTTDGYTGCPGMGRSGAEEFLKEPYMVYQEERVLKSGPRKGQAEWQWKKRPLAEGETLWQAIVALFEKAGSSEEYALQQARVARICRAEDFNLREKQVILWNPPT